MAAQESQENSSSISSTGASNTTVTATAPSTRRRIAQNYLLFWIDASIDQTSKYCENTLAQLRTVVNDVTICTQPDECMQLLDSLNDEKVFVIIPGYQGQDLVSKIHDMPTLDAIYIFCGNISSHQQWTKDWRKVKGVHNNIKDICDALKGGIKQVNQDLIPISFVTANEIMSDENLNQLEPNYMYTQIFKNILLKIEHNQEQAMQILAVYCRNLYSKNITELNVIDEFQRDYRPEQAIWWYTRECFIYQMLNRALRTLDADSIINMGFFIRDLHQQIVQLHEQQLPNYHGKPFIAYRGQGLLKTDFEKLEKIKGGLMSFNNFLSTNTNKEVSLDSAERESTKADMVGILFIMAIDPRVSSTPFASINEVSYFKAEEAEILFAMHTVFRVGEIKQMDNNGQLYEVELQLTDDDDEQLRQLTEFISKEVVGATEWERMGMLLVKTGHFNKAEELYKELLEQSLDDYDKDIYYHQLGYIKDKQGNYEQAVEYYKKALEIEKTNLPANHPSLATTYNNIGKVYVHKGEYSKALSFYKKALGICEQSLRANNPDLATSYSNIGEVYRLKRKYSKALSFYKKALKICENSLPANHPDLATSYDNTGSVYQSMKKYSKALSFYEKAVRIQEEILPENHPDLATSYSIIGSVYMFMGESSKALSFYEKALAIREKTLPTDHPDLGQSYNNLSDLCYNMKEYSKALSFYEKAIRICEKTLPTNHPHLAVSYTNIGKVYAHKGEYSAALSFYKKALEIYEKSPPANHPDLATSYSIIGETYKQMEEYSAALSFYEKALGIEEKALPANHSDLATSYNNIGEVYKKMREYSKALSFYEKALGIQEETLPENHPDLQAVKENIEIVKQYL
ncbi:unnamed protein product [Adineta steineri]|uniref:UDP-N-acetylglucosamine--peptide N-acetylglucosaminyltransferase SPINDLY n=2 Tax=Adineta steineri TaxID=433720 RepID=A0A815C2W4_9BILA|nr:unnamed protein product [Adineta steineri]CAF3571929.1 unnamed protein product [Adineta steineri]